MKRLTEEKEWRNMSGHYRNHGYDMHWRKYDLLRAVFLNSVGNFNPVAGSQNVSNDIKMNHPALFQTIKDNGFKGNFIVASGRKEDKEELFSRLYRAELKRAGKIYALES